MLFLDGVYVKKGDEVRFVQTKPPAVHELTALVQRISVRMARMLERRGIIQRDQDNTHLDLDGIEQDKMIELQGYSIRYRIAVGKQKGQKALTLQTLPAKPEQESTQWLVGKVDSFSLHAGVSAKAKQRWKVERLCRYIARPPVSEARLSMTSAGKVRYELKIPYRNGTTHIIFEPLDLIARLASLVPKPRVNLTRFHGVYAPNCEWCSQVTGKKRRQKKTEDDRDEQERRIAMTWARRLKRVFEIDITTCDQCGGNVKVIACIEDPDVITKILSHINSQPKKQASLTWLPTTRSPPQIELF